MRRATSKLLDMTKAQRTRLIRSRVVTGAVALFVAVWLAIAITLISGNDPALSRNRTTASVTTTTATTTAAATTTSSSGTSRSGTSSSGSGTSSGTSSVTTHQS